MTNACCTHTIWNKIIVYRKVCLVYFGFFGVLCFVLVWFLFVSLFGPFYWGFYLGFLCVCLGVGFFCLFVFPFVEVFFGGVGVFLWFFCVFPTPFFFFFFFCFCFYFLMYRTLWVHITAVGLKKCPGHMKCHAGSSALWFIRKVTYKASL